MITRDQYDLAAHALPFLRKADPLMVREFLRTASYARIPAGRDVFVEGDQTDSIALLVAGVVRVYKISETGREITLYRFGHGESCILTANAILSQQTFPAIATVEQDAQAVMIPADTFRDWVNRFDMWRGFVFDLLSQRLSSLMEILEEVAFWRMDVRLAAFLLERSRSENPVRITHQEIAAELGSSREVISRLLADFSLRGILRLERGAVEILDDESLNFMVSV